VVIVAGPALQAGRQAPVGVAWCALVSGQAGPAVSAQALIPCSPVVTPITSLSWI
jgi:hypothetical protein